MFIKRGRTLKTVYIMFSNYLEEFCSRDIHHGYLVKVNKHTRIRRGSQMRRQNYKIDA